MKIITTHLISACVLVAGLGLARVRLDEKPVLSQDKDKKVADPPKKFTNSLDMEFVLIPKGKSWLGGGNGKEGTNEVKMSQDFYLGAYVVTQDEWRKIKDTNPSYFSRSGAGKDKVKDISDADLKRFPVERVSWNSAQEFIKLLNERVKKDAKEAGWEYRLPTESQWEYACRNGAMTDKAESAFDYYFEKPSKTLSREQANFFDSGLKRACKVGSYLPNRLGLYDMCGNVSQWCDGRFENKKGEALRPCRGGSWSLAATVCRVVDAGWYYPDDADGDLGFRLARIPFSGK